MLADIWQSIPDIIKEAATSPLGIFALMIVALAILAFYFFKDAGTKVKLTIFLLLFVGVAVFAAKVVYKANEVAAADSHEHTTQRSSPAATSHQDSAEPASSATIPQFGGPTSIPGDTGWIFAGYFDTQTDRFVEGPYVESIGTMTRGMRKYIEIGDRVRLKVSRPVIIVGYKQTSTSRALERPPIVGITTSDDVTGVTLPKSTELIVRDIAEGQSPNNPNAALWLRVVQVPQ
jgi:hypothetical protein